MAGKRFVRSSTKRLTSWFEFQSVSVTGSTSGAILFSLNAAALALRPFTIVRSRFETMIESDQAAAPEAQVVGIGAAIVSDQASAIGVTAVSTPITDMGSDLWFLYHLMMAKESTLTDRSQPAGIFTTDSKAMRKVDIGQDLVICAEVSSAGEGAIISFGGRMLVKVN